MARFRTGTKVPLNVYDGDEPIFQAHSERKAAVLVAYLNAGVALHEAYDRLRSAQGVYVPGDQSLIVDLIEAMDAPERPPSAPESRIEGPGPQGEPETAESHTGLASLHCPVCGNDRTPNADGRQTYTCSRCATLAVPVPDAIPCACPWHAGGGR
jgi:hypothetical protein